MLHTTLGILLLLVLFVGLLLHDRAGHLREIDAQREGNARKVEAARKQAAEWETERQRIEADRAKLQAEAMRLRADLETVCGEREELRARAIKAEADRDVCREEAAERRRVLDLIRQTIDETIGGSR